MNTSLSIENEVALFVYVDDIEVDLCKWDHKRIDKSRFTLYLQLLRSGYTVITFTINLTSQ